jgi:hypothetical protein
MTGLVFYKNWGVARNYARRVGITGLPLFAATVAANTDLIGWHFMWHGLLCHRLGDVYQTTPLSQCGASTVSHGPLYSGQFGPADTRGRATSGRACLPCRWMGLTTGHNAMTQRLPTRNIQDL